MFSSKYIKFLLILFLVFLPFCEEEDQGSGSDQWLIPEDEVAEGGPGKDGIPAVSSPKFVPVGQVDYLLDQDLVIGIQIGDLIRAFSHPILDQHEIVNHTIEETSFVLTYCPLTGSAIAWDTSEFTLDHTFGVSGLLYNSNLIPYDRQTDSNWSQMLNLCVNGELVGDKAKVIHVIETTWETWRELYPQSMVLSTDTGFSRDYGVYPYGDYKTSDSLLFSISHSDERLHKKERVHGIIVGGLTKVYVINSFDNPIEVINETFNEVPIVVAGSAEKNFAVAFERKLADGTELTFEPVDDALPVVMKDNEGTEWDIFGNGVSSSREGTKLKALSSYTAYWFAWATFYPDTEIHGMLSGTSLASQMQEISWKSRSNLLRTERELVRYDLKRRILKEWPLILRAVRVVPHKIEGEISGLRVKNLPDNSILTETGISEGDVIRKINDVELKNARELIRLFKEMINENRIDVVVERDGELFHLSYILK